MRQPRQFDLPICLASLLSAKFDDLSRVRLNCALVSLLALSVLTIGGCEKKADLVIDSVGRPPILLQARLNPSSINSDLLSVGSSQNPSDVLTISTTVTAFVSATADNPIASVRFALRNPLTSQIISQGELLDNGGSIDQTKGDSLFTGKATFQITRVEIGIFKAEVLAEAQNGFQSNTVVAPLTIYRGNHPPVLSALVAPDTLTLANLTQLLTLRVKATDPDGLSDISRVIFNTYKPDGTASSGNPFQMFDDGVVDTDGDLTAGDGIYSLTITLPPTTQTGSYTFKFQAFDRSNESSALIIHTIIVKQ